MSDYLLIVVIFNGLRPHKILHYVFPLVTNLVLVGKRPTAANSSHLLQVFQSLTDNL